MSMSTPTTMSIPTTTTTSTPTITAILMTMITPIAIPILLWGYPPLDQSSAGKRQGKGGCGGGVYP